MTDAAPTRATFRDVFAVREFQALWFSQILSVAGDRLALVALTLLVGLGIRARPAAARPESGQQSPLGRMRAGFRLVFTDRALRTITLLAWLVVFYTIPEGVAAPYAARLGAGPVGTGLVLASVAATAGSTAGS